MIKNPAWMKKQHDLPCEVCGSEGNTEGAHQSRAEGGGGIALKSSDDCTIPLCHAHHDMEHRGWFSFWSPLVTGAPVLLRRLLTARARCIYREYFPDEGEILLLDALRYYQKTAKGPDGAPATAALAEFGRLHPKKNLWWRPAK